MKLSGMWAEKSTISLAALLIVVSCQSQQQEDYEAPRSQRQGQRDTDDGEPTVIRGRQTRDGKLSFVLSSEALQKFGFDPKNEKYKYDVTFDADIGDDIKKTGDLKIEADSQQSEPITLTARRGLIGTVLMLVTGDKGTILSGKSKNKVTIGNDEFVDIELTEDAADIKLRITLAGKEPPKPAADTDSTPSPAPRLPLEAPAPVPGRQPLVAPDPKPRPDLSKIADPAVRKNAQAIIDSVPLKHSVNNARIAVSHLCSSCHDTGILNNGVVTSSHTDPNRPPRHVADLEMFGGKQYTLMPKKDHIPGCPECKTLEALDSLGLDYRKLVRDSFPPRPI